MMDFSENSREPPGSVAVDSFLTVQIIACQEILRILEFVKLSVSCGRHKGLEIFFF